MAAHNELGIKGENIACDFLNNKGYRILEKNWRTGKAEVDIIASKDEIIIFAEVKCRSTNAFGEPQLSVNDKKQKMLLEAADVYMQDQPEAMQLRFDVITIVVNSANTEINHIEEAFSPTW